MSNALTEAELDRCLAALNAADTAGTAAARAQLETLLHGDSLPPPQRQRVQAALGDFLRAHGEEAAWPAPAETRYF